MPEAAPQVSRMRPMPAPKEAARRAMVWGSMW